LNPTRKMPVDNCGNRCAITRSRPQLQLERRSPRNQDSSTRHFV
jgi:hypothetical protein